MDFTALDRLHATLSEVGDEALRSKLEDLMVQVLNEALTAPRKREMVKYVENVCVERIGRT